MNNWWQRFKLWLRNKIMPIQNGFGVATSFIPGVVNTTIPSGTIIVSNITDNVLVKTTEQVVIHNLGGPIKKNELVIYANVDGKFIAQNTSVVLNEGGGGTGSGTGTGTGSGSGGQVKIKGIKLVRKQKDVIGTGFHRSGWPYVFSYLASIEDENGILFDDFIEQNFCYKDKPDVYREPWIGIFHHPPTIPYFGNMRERLDLAFQKPEFLESVKFLKVAITLSEHLAAYLRTKLTCPVIALKHPAMIPTDKWTEEKFNNNPTVRFIQLGYYLRNTQLIRHIPPSSFHKTRLWINREWVNQFDKRVEEYYSFDETRLIYNDYEDINFVSPSKFDKMLCENIVVMELFDASANNAILDCMVRNTPVFVNKHPAVVEYLGEDYPGYFEHPTEIPVLASETLFNLNRYLSDINKDWMNPEYFVSQITQIIENL